MKKLIFLSHPYSTNPALNAERVKFVEERILEMGYIPISPLALFRMYIKDGDDREQILHVCREMIKISDEVWFFTYENDDLSSGQAFELGCSIELNVTTKRIVISEGTDEES